MTLVEKSSGEKEREEKERRERGGKQRDWPTFCSPLLPPPFSLGSLLISPVSSKVEKLKNVRAARDQQAADTAIANLIEGAKGSGNLLALSIEAARVRCTLGEISDALETVSLDWAEGSSL